MAKLVSCKQTETFHWKKKKKKKKKKRLNGKLTKLKNRQNDDKGNNRLNHVFPKKEESKENNIHTKLVRKFVGRTSSYNLALETEEVSDNET